MNLKEFFQSKTSNGILIGVGIVLVALIIFQAGVFVGYRRASFSYKLGDNYYRTFGGPVGAHLPGFPKDDFPNAHGIVGKIIKVELPKLFVAGDDGVEKAFLISSSTVIRQFRDPVDAKLLKANDLVVVVGSPNSDSIIEAKLIRILPQQ